jgi:hypothetical protein
METNTTMPRKRETPIDREPMAAPDAAQELLEAAWLHCGMIQDVVERLNDPSSSTELRLLANRLQRLAFRATRGSYFRNLHPAGPDAWASG